jgi:hypothetical protein
MVQLSDERKKQLLNKVRRDKKAPKTASEPQRDWKPVSGTIVPAVTGVAEAIQLPMTLGRFLGEYQAQAPFQGEAQAQRDYDRMFGRPPVDLSPEAIAEAEKPYYHPLEGLTSILEKGLSAVQEAPHALEKFLREQLDVGEPTTGPQRSYEDLVKTISQTFTARGVGLPGAETRLGELGLATLSSLAGSAARELGEIPGVEAVARGAPYLLGPVISYLRNPGSASVAGSIARMTLAAEQELGRALTAEEQALLQNIALQEEANVALRTAQSELAEARMAGTTPEGLMPSTKAGKVVELYADAVTAAGVPTKAGNIFQSSVKEAGESFMQRMRRLFKLEAPSGRQAAPLDKSAARLRQMTQNARKQAVKPLNDRYRSWEYTFINQVGPVEGSALAELHEATTAAINEMRASVPQATTDAMREALGMAANDLQTALQSLGSNSVEVSVSKLRDIQKAIRERTKFAMPGDKARMLEPIDAMVDSLIGQIVGQEGHQALRQLSSDYRAFKQTFDNQPLVRRILSDQKSASDAFKAINDAEDMAAVIAAAGPDAGKLVSRYHLQDILKLSPTEALERLERMGHVQAGMGADEFNTLLRDLRKGVERVEISGALAAYDEITKTALNREVPLSVRQRALKDAEAMEELLKRTPEGREKVKALQKAREAVQRAEATFEASQARVLKQTQRTKDAGVIEAFLKRENLSADQVSELLAKANALGGDVPRLASDAIVGRYLGPAKGSPTGIAAALREHEAILSQVMPFSSIQEIRTLAERMPEVISTMERIPQRVADDIQKSLPGMYKGKGIIGYFKKAGLQTVIDMARSRLPVQKLIENILSGDASRMARAIRELATATPGAIRAATQAIPQGSEPDAEERTRAGQPRVKRELSARERELLDRVRGRGRQPQR